VSARSRLDAWRDRRLDPLAFRIDGRLFEVAEHPARVWVLAILSDEPADLLLEVLPDDVAEELWDTALDPDEDLDPALLHRIGQGLLAQAAGRPWWQATMLVATMVDGWDTFIAVARDRGLGDPLDWPLDELCAWVYLRLTQHAKKEDVARLDAELASPPLPPADVDPDDDSPIEGEEDGWLALAAQMAAPTGG